MRKINEFKWQTASKNVLEIDSQTRLGKGSYGEVFKGNLFLAKQKSHVDVAVKIIKIDSSQTEKLAFMEFQIIKKNQDNAGVVKLYDHCMNYQTKEFFLILEMCNESLARFINKNNMLNKQVMLSVVVQIIQAVMKLHLNQTIHRDLKESNILVKYSQQDPKKPQIHLTDFGLSKAIEEDSTKKGDSKNACGHYQYLAPEALFPESQKLDHYKLDSWALGVMLYKILFKKEEFIVCQNPEYTAAFQKDFKKQIKILKKKFFNRPAMETMNTLWGLDHEESEFFKYLFGMLLDFQIQSRFSIIDLENRAQPPLQELFKKIRMKYAFQESYCSKNNFYIIESGDMDYNDYIAGLQSFFS